MEVCLDASVAIVTGGRSLNRQPSFQRAFPRRLTRAGTQRTEWARSPGAATGRRWRPVEQRGAGGTFRQLMRQFC